MRGTRIITSLAMNPALPRVGELSTGRRSFLVEAASDLLANDPIKIQAARLLLIGAFHRNQAWRYLFNLLGWHLMLTVAGLTPVERYPEKGAAGSTRRAGGLV